MAINFTDSPVNGATQTISGRTYTYNSAKNKWDTTATEVTGPTATVYASVDSLPLSGNITGSQALVTLQIDFIFGMAPAGIILHLLIQTQLYLVLMAPITSHLTVLQLQ